MPQQSTLIARPVILSENKQNAIPHGKPLSAMGDVRSARPFFVPRPRKGSFTEEKHGDAISVNKASPTSTSSMCVMDYQKLANENLITINNNLSLLLKESFAGIDNICKKVRMCLLNANTTTPPENRPAENLQLRPAENLQLRRSENLQIRRSENLETLKPENLERSISESLEIRKVQTRTDMSASDSIETRAAPFRRESFQLLSTCDEEIESSASVDEVPELPEDPNEATTAERVEGRVYEKQDQNKENGINKSKRSPTITPFFTVLNPNTQSAIGVNIIRSMSSRIGLSRKCTSENFQEAMREVEKLNDYEEFLTSMVEGINREIDQCYAAFPRVEATSNNDGKKDDGKKDDGKKDDRKKDGKPTPTRCQKRKEKIAVSEDLKRFHEMNKVQRDLMEDQFSENDLTTYRSSQRRMGMSVYAAKLDFTYPDVYRKRAITDLHKRLEAQVEANDSLIFFQKLMAKSMKHMNDDRPATTDDKSIEKPAEGHNFKCAMQYLEHQKGQQRYKKQRSLSELSRKYQNSLWFKQKKPEAKRSKRETSVSKKKREKKNNKDKPILPQSYTIESSTASVGRTSVVNKSSFKSPFPVNILAAACNCQVTVTNNQPMSEAQKCKLHWMRAKYSQLRQKKLKYLDILDDITKNDLLPIKAEYPRRDTIKSTSGVKESYLHKLLYGKNRETQNAWEQLFQPTLKCPQEHGKKSSKANVAIREDAKKNINEPNLIYEKNSKQYFLKTSVSGIEMGLTCDLDKGDVIRKLSKYIFADEVQQTTSNRVYTVMPVHVFYDNARIPPDTRRHAEGPPQKLPLLPMKEIKDFVKNAEANDVAARRAKPTRVVYDPILKKIDKDIRMGAVKPEIKPGNARMGQTNSWSPKNFAQYCAPVVRQAVESRVINTKVNPIDRRPKNPPAANRPVPVAELFKRPSKPSTEQINLPPVPTLWNSPNADAYKYQKDTEVRQKIQKTISAEATSRMKSDQQRKMWENKYGKSVGQKLINFIEKQPDHYQIPVPKYALPSKSGPKAAARPGKHQVMLDQLRNLKQKNDNIQTNIQKAIVVIENKMVDILSKPTTSESIEAFDAMEKEITNVLSLMKAPTVPKTLNKTEKMGYDHEGDISDELFQRLDRILESPCISEKGSKDSSRKDRIAKRRKKLEGIEPQKSTDMNQVCFSSTSATGEETFTITAISPKRPFKSPTTMPYVKDAMDKTAADDISTIAHELSKLEHELNLNHTPNDVDQSRDYPDAAEAKPIKEQNTVPKRSSILKHRKSVPGQDQVVNIALVSQVHPEGSAGDQLQELKKLLENELKSVDGSDEKSHSLAVSFSQGDYAGSTGVKGEGEEDQRHSKLSENTELDVQSALEEETSGRDPNTATAESSSNKRNDVRSMHETIKMKLVGTIASERPKTPVIHQLKGSQLSLDVTGPYFTPLTSPLVKKRCQIDEIDHIQRCSILEEEKLSSASHTEDCDEKQTGGKEDANKNEGELLTQNKDGDDSKQVCLNKELAMTSFLDDSDSKSEKDNFYENVNRIISRVENVYNQLEEFEEEMLEEQANRPPVYQNHEPHPSPEITDLESDQFLAPFIQVVKDMRKRPRSLSSQKSSPRSIPSQKSSPRMNRSSSMYNVLNFLDNLSDIREERPVEVFTPRVYYVAYIVHIPQTFYQFFIQEQSTCTATMTVPEEATEITESEDKAIAPTPSLAKPLSADANKPVEIPKKTSGGCLKTSSKNSKAVMSKSKQKVSFLLVKEEKSTQVASCPFHNVARMLSQQKINITSTAGTVTGEQDNTLASTKKDEQVSAYLDACENKSVDKMSIPDDETYQSTLDFSDENSSAKNSRMPEQIVQNLQETLEKNGKEEAEVEKNVVEIFRNSNGEENCILERPAVLPSADDVAETKRSLEGAEGGVQVDSEEVVEEAVSAGSEELNLQPAVKVFYDNYKSGKDQSNLKLTAGIYNERSILQVKSSLSRDLAAKKHSSLEKLLTNLNQEILSTRILEEEASLLEPLKNLNQFVDSNLLKEAVEKRRAIRMLRRKGSLTTVDGRETNQRTHRFKSLGDGEKENLLKGFYVFVYLLMFTALNLDYKCVQ